MDIHCCNWVKEKIYLECLGWFQRIKFIRNLNEYFMSPIFFKFIPCLGPFYASTFVEMYHQICQWHKELVKWWTSHKPKQRLLIMDHYLFTTFNIEKKMSQRYRLQQYWPMEACLYLHIHHNVLMVAWNEEIEPHFK